MTNVLSRPQRKFSGSVFTLCTFQGTKPRAFVRPDFQIHRATLSVVSAATPLSAARVSRATASSVAASAFSSSAALTSASARFTSSTPTFVAASAVRSAEVTVETLDLDVRSAFVAYVDAARSRRSSLRDASRVSSPSPTPPSPSRTFGGGVAARDARSFVAVFAFSSFVRNSRSRVSSFVLVSSLAFCSSALVAKRSKRVSTVSARRSSAATRSRIATFAEAFGVSASPSSSALDSPSRTSSSSSCVSNAARTSDFSARSSVCSVRAWMASPCACNALWNATNESRTMS